MAKESAAKLRRLVGRRISETRRSREWNQETLATRLSVSTQWLSRCENGHENLTLDTLAKIANALNVKVVDLMTDDPIDRDLPQRVRPRRSRS